MSSMHSLIWFYDIEALTIFQLAQIAGGSQDQLGDPGSVQAYLQQWLVLITVLIGITALLGLYGVFQHRLRLPKTHSFALLILLVALVLVPVTYLGVNDIRTAGDDRSTVYRLADGLRQTSDDLTRMVRLYAASGDPLYREYFQEILDIRNGLALRPEQYFDIPYWDVVLATGERPGAAGAPASIQSLMQRAGLTAEEESLLQEAESQSNILAELEFELMDVVAAQTADGGGYVPEGAAAEALQRLHGQEYHDAKALVMQPLVGLVSGSGLDMLVVEGSVHNFLQGRLDALTVLIGLAALVVAFIVILHRTGQARFNTLALLLLLGSLFLSRQILTLSDEGGLSVARRHSEALLSDGLRQTSDDLTRMARLYTVSGEDRYREYFQEILDIRNGDAPRPELYFQVPYWDFVLAINQRLGETGNAESIRSLMQTSGINSVEADLLSEAEDQSNALAVLENEAMDTVARQVEAGGEYVLAGEALAAMQRLHGAEYHEAKARVMQPLVQLSRRFEQGAREEEEFSQSDLRQGMLTLGLAMVLAALLMAVALYQARREAVAAEG